MFLLPDLSAVGCWVVTPACHTDMQEFASSEERGGKAGGNQPIIKQSYGGVTLGGLRCLGRLRRVWGQAAFMRTMILTEAVAAAWKLLFHSLQEFH